jgi:hypothetical protein
VMRLTLDFDDKGFTGKFRVTVAWLTLKVLSRNRQYARKSANKGWHLKAHGLRHFRLIILLRLLLGEDRMRVKFDLVRQRKPKQILWSHKDGKSAGKWSKNLMEVIR